MKKYLLVAAGTAFLAICGLAYAQVLSLSTLVTLSPTVDIIPVVPGGAPQANQQWATVAKVTSAYGYYKSAPATSPLTLTFGDSVSHAVLRPTGTLAAAYFTLAANPSDGMRECVFTTAQLTATYVAANTSQSINNALSATNISANTSFCYLYSASNLTWDRD